MNLKKGGSRIILANETRWCSSRDALRCLLKNLHHMRALVKENVVKIDVNYRELLHDLGFDIKLRDYILILDPICELVNFCRRSDARLADTCRTWLTVRIPTYNNSLEEILGARMEKVLTPIVLAANLLHPAYQGKIFRSTDQLEMA